MMPSTDMALIIHPSLWTPRFPGICSTIISLSFDRGSLPVDPWTPLPSPPTHLQEALLKREMSVMVDRLARAHSEAQQLKAEREEVHAQLRDLEGLLSSSRVGERDLNIDIDLELALYRLYPPPDKGITNPPCSDH